ncbi:hypothetical protein PVAP13_7KG372101 [Panicum virgatum]|uniref:Uncharacterized protein n=1 Tax=Panicum virgatum TaxID=38727 RepID=A0A8T0QRP6_PANVG|nr:hypothetical protein PVAP13_7KG372101 [Panicum virgatum]
MGERGSGIACCVSRASAGSRRVRAPFPHILKQYLGKLYSIPAGEIQGVHVVWTPQQQNDLQTEYSVFPSDFSWILTPF